MPDRSLGRDALLAAAGWSAAQHAPLAGDASPRRYERLTRSDGATSVLMDADPATGEDVGTFIAIARHLATLGLSPPDILAADTEAGFLLLEDLGDALFARVLAVTPACEPVLYDAAVDVLAHLQANPPPSGLADYDAAAMGAASGLAATWYAAAATGQESDPAALEARVAEAVADLPGPRVIALRDYHAENLIWLPERTGLRRVGLLDFQSAELAPAAYDLVSLVQDARRDVAPAVGARAITRFAEATGALHGDVTAAVAVLGAQRALRILGVFARLCLRDAKPGYLRLIPRVWGQLQENLAAPGLAPLAREVARILPPPSETVLARLKARCGTLPAR